MSTPMVCAVLDDQKTITRRIVKGMALAWLLEFEPEFVASEENGLCPYGYPGDLLWVRETHYRYGSWKKRWSVKKEREEWVFTPDSQFKEIRYYNNPPEVIERGRKTTTGWYKRPSIHMPKAAARLWLEVVSVRIERLHDITEEDAIAEGIEDLLKGNELELNPAYRNYTHNPPKKEAALRAWEVCADNALHSFKSLWQYINGVESWEANPWVWRIEFKRIEK